MKKQPKPLPDSLTKKGEPRKNAPGAGRPTANRKTRLSLVTQEGHGDITAIAEIWECSQAEAIERMARETREKLSKIQKKNAQ